MNCRTDLHRLVDRFPGRRVVLYGDFVLDRFVLGTPTRISREAPVIILSYEGQRDLPGGGANALANIAALGGTAIPVGILGDDEPGRALLTALAEFGIDTSSISVSPDLRTISKVRILAGGPTSLRHQVARYDIEDRLADDAAATQVLFERLDKAAATADAAAISDYGYGVVSSAGVARLRARLKPGAPAVMDSRFALTTLGEVDGATPNLEELAAVTGDLLTGDADVARAAEALRQSLNARFLLATRGSQGMTLVESDGCISHIPVYGAEEVADVTGAGDTVLATLTLALAAGATPLQAATIANLAGGIVVMKLGTATVSRNELHRAIDISPFIDDQP